VKVGTRAGDQQTTAAVAYVTIVLVFGKSGNTEVVALSAAVTFLLWFLSSLATLPLSVHSRHAKCWTSAAFSICATSSTGDHDRPLTGVDVVNTPAPHAHPGYRTPVSTMAFSTSGFHPRRFSRHKISTSVAGLQPQSWYSDLRDKVRQF